jgi:release factor glutamine methyltransferase
VNLKEALREGALLIHKAGSDEAQLEAELILRHTLYLDRVHLYQRLQDRLTDEEQETFQRLLNRRLAHEPTAYILGHREFFGLEFEVTPAAIIPRPETETVVELVIAFARDRHGESPVTIADVGAGSGAIAVSLAQAIPQAQIIAIDISPEALSLAARNARRHGVADRINFLCGDLLQSLEAPVDIIAANLPYVRSNDWEAMPPEIRDHEPRTGLDGGADGLRVIARLLDQAPKCLNTGGALFAEIGDQQGELATKRAREAFPPAQIEVKRDLAEQDRVLVIRN